MDIVEISRTSFKFRMLKWVNNGRVPRRVDECTLRAAFLKVPFKLLGFLFWDLWVAMARTSRTLLGFLGGTILATLVWGLAVFAPEVLLFVLLVLGVTIGILLLMILSAGGLAYLADEHRFERWFWRTVDSAPARMVIKVAKWMWFRPLLPVKWIFYDFGFVRVSKKNGDTYSAIWIGGVLLLSLGSGIFLLVYNLIFNTFWALIGLSVALGFIFLIVLCAILANAGFFRYLKERICRPVTFVD